MAGRIATTVVAVALLAAGSAGRAQTHGLRAPAAPRQPAPSLIELAGPTPAVAARPAGAVLAADLPADAVEIAIAGDVNLGGRIGELIVSRGAGYPWTRVRDVLRRADVAVVNLECAVSSRGSPHPGKQFTFRGKPASVAGMADAGVDVASVANNHSLDFGRDAFADTLDALRDAGIRPVGGGRHADEAYAPAVVQAGGMRVAFLGATRVLPLGFAAGRATAGVASAYDEARLVGAVRAARSAADVVVVVLHWGVELQREPNAAQVRLARALVDAGASVVAGAHPHVLQPVVADRRAVIAYSLGNFVFSSGSAAASTTALLRVGVRPDGSLVAAPVPMRIVAGRPEPAGP